jgi:hypothetical protein
MAQAVIHRENDWLAIDHDGDAAEAWRTSTMHARVM